MDYSTRILILRNVGVEFAYYVGGPRVVPVVELCYPHGRGHCRDILSPVVTTQVCTTFCDGLLV